MTPQNQPPADDGEVQQLIIQFQKDTLEEWRTGVKNVGMIELAYKFAATITAYAANHTQQQPATVPPQSLREQLATALRATLEHEYLRDHNKDFWKMVDDVHMIAADRAAAAERVGRIDELRLACEHWERNPSFPATYMIDRTTELTAGAGESKS